MTALVYVAPPTVEPPAREVWTHNAHTWTGWNHTEESPSVWDLCTGVSGVVLQAEVRGLSMPPIQHHFSDSPAVHGTWWRGMHIGPRDVFWPIMVHRDTGSVDWLAHNRAWWKTLHPEKTGVWAVTQPDGETRRLRLRFVDDGQKAFDIAPELVGWAMYGVSLIAEDPMWKGDPITRSFAGPSEVYFFGAQPTSTASPTLAGPPFGISQSSSFSTASIPNPGDIEAWPVWTLRGPMTTASVGVGSRVITVPITLQAGQWVRVDTDPRRQTAIDQAGVDRIAALSSYDFASVPAGAEVPLSATLTGTGTVDIEITPSYLWAA